MKIIRARKRGLNKFEAQSLSNSKENVIIKDLNKYEDPIKQTILWHWLLEHLNFEVFHQFTNKK